MIIKIFNNNNQFSIFRISLGFYLFYHFFSFFWDQEHVFSINGPIQSNYKFLPFALFPNIIDFITTDAYLKIFWLIMCLLSLLLILGLFRRFICIPLWFGWACFFNFNTLVINPASSVVGWLILFTALVPTGEPLSWQSKPKTTLKSDWQLSSVAIFSLWIFLGYTMSVSGVQKIISSDTWVDGSTLYRIIHDYPLTRVNLFTDFTKIIPAYVLKFLTWIFLMTEALFLPLVFFKYTRIFIWFLSAFMLLSSMLIIDFTPIPIGILLCYILLFDPKWIPTLMTYSPFRSRTNPSTQSSR